MKFTTFVLCLLTLCALSLPKSAHAQGNYATVSMGLFTDYGDLTTFYGIVYTGSGSGATETSVVALPNQLGHHRIRSGSTYGKLKNNTYSAVTLSSPAILNFRASGSCLDTGTAEATITLGVTAHVSVTVDDDDGLNDPKTKPFYAVDLQPGDEVPADDGTFTVEATNTSGD